MLDMASSYSTFRDRGEHRAPVMVVRVTDDDGRVLFDADRSTTRVIPTEIADQVTMSLEGVVLDGTGRSAAVPGQIVAGKTGTTTDNRDAWFVGYSCEISTAVWMGYPTGDAEGNPRLMGDFRGIQVTGGSFPAEIWSAFMTRALEGRAPCPFPDVELEPGTTTTLDLNCPVDSTDTTDPGTPIELCPPVTTDSSTTTTTDGDGSTTTTAPPPSTTTTAPPATTTTTPPTTEAPDPDDG